MKSFRPRAWLGKYLIEKCSRVKIPSRPRLGKRNEGEIFRTLPTPLLKIICKTIMPVQILGQIQKQSKYASANFPKDIHKQVFQHQLFRGYLHFSKYTRANFQGTLSKCASANLHGTFSKCSHSTFLLNIYKVLCHTHFSFEIYEASVPVPIIHSTFSKCASANYS